ncbi:hypothetical protein Dsin_026526 [Dipteronia sinensis]|uniref:Phytocyanin domain-containing protein n=1 Tax=Dipteronia sinensis TaxID=43782 RepID=A0AAD9ZYH4_9ROSI|nr:hypothetical protein Dsin_026526 [Dipteronia sinensis]
MYFTCPTAGHCSSGMKLAMTVTGTPTTPSGTPPSGSDTPSTTTVRVNNDETSSSAAVLAYCLFNSSSRS